MTSIRTSLSDFSGSIITPDDAEYDAARVTYMATGQPKAVVYPHTADDIKAALRYAAENDLVLSVRSGGHSGMGHSTNDGGIIIDMKNFVETTIVDKAKGIVRVGSGALWGNVAHRLESEGLVVSAGDTKSVGVGGLTLGGGIGIMVRKFGLAIDQLVGAEVVTADGRVVRADKNENADLFWALRGGGGNFGIVTHFDFAAHRLGDVFFGSVTYELDNIKQLLTGWRNATRTSPKEVTTTLVVMPGFNGAPQSAVLLYCFAGNDKEASDNALAPFLKIAPVGNQNVVLMPYADALQEAHPPAGVIPAVKDGLMRTLSDDFIDILTTVYEGATDKMMFLRSLGGAVADHTDDETAFSHRNAEALLVCAAFLPEGATAAAAQAALKFFDEKIAPLAEGAYPNFFSTYNDDDFARMYPDATLRRLNKIKDSYDPTNLFAMNYNITPDNA